MRFSQKLSNLQLWCLLMTCRKLYKLNWAFLLDTYNLRWLISAILKIDMTLFYSAGGPIWIKFCRLVKNDMSTAVIASKLKPDVEFQYGIRLGEFSDMSYQSHVSHCRVLLLGEFTVMIPEPRATLQGAVTWRNQCRDHATLQGVRIPSVILKIVFHHILFFCFLKCSLGFDKRRLSYRLRYTCFFVDTVYTT